MSSSSRHPPSRSRRNRRLNDTPATLPAASDAFCVVCGTTQDPSDPDSAQLYELPCGHHHCSRCLGLNFGMAVRGRPFAPARCCAVTPAINPETLRAAVGAAQVEKHMDSYLAQLGEYDCKDKLYCHVKACSAFIPLDKRSQKVGNCPKCALRTCKRCRAKSHWGACPADKLKDIKGDEQLLALAGKKNWKQCPSCSVMVEKVAGCWHMTCVCGCHFCYECGRTPSDNHGCVRGMVAALTDDEDEEEEQ